MAPEFSSGNITEKYDIWSCGVILFILLSGVAPFTGKTEEEILTKSRKGVIRFSGKAWKQVSSDAKDLVVKMLTKDVSRRISAKEAWGCPWVQSSVMEINRTVTLNNEMMKNLEKFQKTSRLQKATLAFITSTMVTNKEIGELKDAFVVLDTDGDGQLTELELSRGFEGLSISPAGSVKDIIQACDIDLNGLLDYNEFLTATFDWQRRLSHELLENVFAIYDQDSSGTISLEEVRRFLGQTGDDDFFKKLVSEGDLNGDGEIDLKEFKTLMLSVI
jgi:calcium-dependent protein kinase